MIASALPHQTAGPKALAASLETCAKLPETIRTVKRSLPSNLIPLFGGLKPPAAKNGAAMQVRNVTQLFAAASQTGDPVAPVADPEFKSRCPQIVVSFLTLDRT